MTEDRVESLSCHDEYRRLREIRFKVRETSKKDRKKERERER